jgi:putative aminopeptidase FrvX
MLAIPSPTGFTDTIVRYVAERLDELGIPFELTRRGTIRATLKGRQSSPDRAVSAHLDTIGASVRQLQDNGRLALAAVGCWSSRFAEGSRVSVFTDTGVYRGSVLPLMASGHAFNTAIDQMPISWEHVEVRLDAYCTTRADCEALGIASVISSPSTRCRSSPKAATSAPVTSTTRPAWRRCWQRSRRWWKAAGSH